MKVRSPLIAHLVIVASVLAVGVLAGCDTVSSTLGLPFGQRTPTPDAVATQAAIVAAARGTPTPWPTTDRGDASVDPASGPTADIAACRFRASFLDETIPDNTRISGGEAFTKTWRFRNTGTCPWGEGYILAHREGERMAAVDAVALPATAPGEVATISLEMIAPAAAGTYRSTWQICARSGEGLECAGSRVWAQIVAVPSTPTRGPTAMPTATLTPSVTPSPTSTPTPTATLTPSITATPSLTPTPSDTPTPSLTPTPSDTPTPSLTPTPSETPTLTPTATHTATPTLTPTFTSTPTATLTPSITPTPTATRPPDFRQLAYVVTDPGGNQEIRVGQLDGQADVRITNHPAYDAWPIWQPGGALLAWVSRRDGNLEVYVANADGSGARNVTRNPADDAWPSWSPDGTRLAFASEGQLCTIGVDGRGRTCLAETTMSAPAAWSPDGTRLIYECSGDLCLVGADGQGQTNLTSEPALDFWPVWSTDGTRVAFVSGRDRNWEIYVQNLDGSRLRNLTESASDDRWPAWSPDGRRLAFASYRTVDGVARWDIYVIDADGSDLRRLPTGGYARMPSWSPDGETLAFYSDHDGVLGQVCTIDLNGRNMACLASGAQAGDLPPAWRK